MCLCDDENYPGVRGEIDHLRKETHYKDDSKTFEWARGDGILCLKEVWIVLLLL